MSTTKYCPQCNNEVLNKNNRFCNSSCSASYNNSRRKPHSQETKNKIAESVRKNCKPPKLYGTDHPNYKHGNSIPKLRNCIVCNVEFFSTRKCCSTECVNQNNVKSGKISASVRRSRSKDEIKLYEMCNKYFENCFANYIIADGWDADIVFMDHKVAIFWNGPWHYKQMPLKNHSLKQIQNRDKIKKKLFESLGWKIYIFQDNEYTPETAFKEITEYSKDW